jgi:probable HAF family extracellular repeat protein
MLILSCALGVTLPAKAGSLTFVTFDVPGATGTRAYGVNAAGQIVGTFTDAGGKYHGYLRTFAGTFTTIDAPGSAGTEAFGINAAGQIVGNFWGAGAAPPNSGPALSSPGGVPHAPGSGAPMGSIISGHGYLRTSGGAFTTIDPPSAMVTQARGINAAGQIVGSFKDWGGVNIHDFLRTARGAFTEIDAPGATGACLGNQALTSAPGVWCIGAATHAFGINDAGQIVGFFVDAGGGKIHGYLRTAEGAFTTIDVPGATATVALGINGAGEIVGYFIVGIFVGAGVKGHGFLRTAGGAFTTIDAPGATVTFASGINGAGQIVGLFRDADGKDHGFVATPTP